jgi:hypothetical protein
MWWKQEKEQGRAVGFADGLATSHRVRLHHVEDSLREDLTFFSQG